MSQARQSAPAAVPPSPETGPAHGAGAPLSLDALRERLDGVDGALHALIADRFAIVEAIAAAKGPGGVVIRPDREAAVLAQRLAAAGAVPPAVLAGFWRLLVSGACMAQRPYRVHVTAATGEAGRILHGAAPAVRHGTAAAALNALADAPGDVAIIAEADIPATIDGPVHAVLAAKAEDGHAVVFGGAGVEAANGPAALVASGTGAKVVAAPGDGHAVLARIHLFPLPLSVSVTAS